MGQQAMALIFGVGVPDDMDLHGDDGPGFGLLGDYEEERRADIQALEKSGKLKRYEYAPRRFVPDTFGEDVYLLGFAVAVGGSGEANVPFFGASMPLADVRREYRVALKNARIRWRRFKRWAKTRGVDLPCGRLWITTCNVA